MAVSRSGRRNHSELPGGWAARRPYRISRTSSFHAACHGGTSRRPVVGRSRTCGVQRTPRKVPASRRRTGGPDRLVPYTRLLIARHPCIRQISPFQEGAPYLPHILERPSTTVRARTLYRCLLIKSLNAYITPA